MSFENLLIESMKKYLDRVTTNVHFERMTKATDALPKKSPPSEYDIPDTPSKSEYLIFDKNIPDELKTSLLAKNSKIAPSGEIALPVSANVVDNIHHSSSNMLLQKQKLAAHLKTTTDLIDKHLIGSSTVPYHDEDKSHYALLDAPIDTEKEFAGNKNVFRSNKGTYFVKTSKALHDMYQKEKGIGARRLASRSHVLILRNAGIDPYKANKGGMRVDISKTLSPEDIERMKKS